MSFYIDKNIELSLKTFSNLLSQLDDEFKNDLKELCDWQAEVLSKLKEQKRNVIKIESPANNPSSSRKRKIKNADNGNEELDVPVQEQKKLRSMDGMEGKENLKPQSNNLNHSTPNKDVVDQSALCPEEEVSIVTALDKPRAKRNASVLAAAMSNKMLNEKLNAKKRRPESQNNSRVQEILLDQQPSTLLSNVLKTKNKQQSLSLAEDSPIGKSGLNNLTTSDSPLSVISEKFESEKENQSDTTVTRSSRRAKKTASEAPPAPNHNPDNTTVKEDPRNASAAQDVDTVIMPPPTMPIIKKSGRRGRPKKNDKNDSTIESDNDTSTAAPASNTSTRSLRTRSTRTNESKVVDETFETSTRSTRSRSNISVEVVPVTEKPKRAGGKKAKEVKEEKVELETPVVEIPVEQQQQPETTTKKKRQTAADTSDSDEEFEKKKVKLRPKRTRKGKKQTQLPSIESETSEAETKQQQVTNARVEEVKKDVIVETMVEKQSTPQKTRLSNTKAEEVKAKSPKTTKNDNKKTKAVVETKEPESVPIRRTRSSNKMTDVEEASLTSKGVVKSNVIVNETYVAASPQVSNKKGKTVLNETVVLEKSSERGTIVLNTTFTNHGLPEIKDSSAKKGQALDQTVTITHPKQNGSIIHILDETITLEKGAIIQYDPEHSLLTDDLSEAEDTPPPLQIKQIPKFIADKKIKDVLSSPTVKSKVQHFERLAETLSPVKNVVSVDAPTGVTRSKVGAICAVKDGKTVVENVEREMEQIDVEPPVKKDKRSKLATPLNGKTISQLKQPLPVPVSKLLLGSSKPGPASMKAALSVNDLLMSPRSNSNLSSVTQIITNKDDALKKREAMLQARSEEQRRKREEKCKAAALAREAQAKQKQALWERAEKEKEEKLRQLHMEREEKLKEDAEKRRLLAEKKLQETEKRRKAEEAARHAKMLEQEEEARKQAALRKKQQEEEERLHEKLAADERETARKLQEMKNQSKSKKAGSLLGQQKIRKSFKKVEQLNTDDESEDESKITRVIPVWSRKDHRYEAMKVQYYVKPFVVDKLYSATIFNPNLMEIFPQIDRKKLVRTSSAVWKTPPRFSMMPREYQ